LATFLIDLSPNDMAHRLTDALTVYVDAMRYPRGTEGQRAAMWLEHTHRHGWKAVAAVEYDAAEPLGRRHQGAEPLGRRHQDTEPLGRRHQDTEPLGRRHQDTEPLGRRHQGGEPLGRRHQEGAGEQAATEQLYSAPLLGIAYGYCGAPDQWWQQQVVSGMHRIGVPADEVNRLMSSYFELTELHIHPSAQGRGLGEALIRRLLAGRGEANVLLSTPEIIGEANRAWRLYRRLGFTDVIRGYHFAGDPRAFAILGRSLPL
jgi:ribosomal protein S18 acetylase RimI-like enzyme